MDARFGDLYVVSNLDQVVVRVAKIDGAKLAHCSGTFNGAFLDMHSQFPEVGDDLFKRSGCDKAQVTGSWSGMRRFRLKLVSTLMQVDTLLAKREGLPAIMSDDVHAKDFTVEVRRCIQFRHRQYQVVQGFDGKGHARNYEPVRSYLASVLVGTLKYPRS